MGDCTNALKQWTGKQSATILFDSNADEFTADGFFDKIQGKPNIAVIGITTDGDVFGGFYSRAVDTQNGYSDPNIFAFSFESHGRCKTPQKFDLKPWMKIRSGVFLWKNHNKGFIWFYVHDLWGFWLGNEKSYSCCRDVSSSFRRLEDTTLSGKNLEPYRNIRLVAVQLH